MRFETHLNEYIYYTYYEKMGIYMYNAICFPCIPVSDLLKDVSCKRFDKAYTY